MTGLEKVQDLPEVKFYLGVTGRILGHLMPGWPGWDQPHLITRRGGILPVWDERLVRDANRFVRLWMWVCERKIPQTAKRAAAIARRVNRRWR